MPDTRPRALVADADLSTRLLLSHHLEIDGFRVDLCTDGYAALDRLNSGPFALAVLDAGLPHLDGIALCRTVRTGEVNSRAAIFVVAASSDESDKLAAFTSGADDCVTRPVAIREFMARVAAVMRRASPPADKHAGAIERTDLRVDPSRRQVIVRGQDIGCSRQEFELLYALASSPGIVFSREELLARSWSHGSLKDIRLVDPIVSRLRRKIERAPDSPRLILTVWGIGYKFSEIEV